MVIALLGLSDSTLTPTPTPTPRPVPAPEPTPPVSLDQLPITRDYSIPDDEYGRDVPILTQMHPTGPPTSDFQQRYIERFMRVYGERPTWGEILYAWDQEWQYEDPGPVEGDWRRTGPLTQPGGVDQGVSPIGPGSVNWHGQPVEI